MNIHDIDLRRVFTRCYEADKISCPEHAYSVQLLSRGDIERWAKSSGVDEQAQKVRQDSQQPATD